MLMNYGITFALLSLFFAGINDVVFKRYSIKDRSRGVYILGIGIIWTGLQLLTFWTKGISFTWDSNTIVFGAVAGLFLALSNILLLESLTFITVGLGSMIYRLNTIGVIMLSFFLLCEPIGIFKSLGILLGIVGVIFLYQRQKSFDHRRKFLFFFSIAIIASLLRAAYGVSAKAGILRASDPDTMLLLISLSWIIGGFCYAILREKRLRLTKKGAAYSIVSGVLVFLIVNCLMLALKFEQASIVIPIANMSFIMALTISIMIKMEKLTTKKILAIVCAIASIVLLSNV